MIVEASLVDSCKYLPTLLYLIWLNSAEFQYLKPSIKRLYNHHEHDVRWRVALVLERMRLDYAEDIAVIHALMHDEYHTTRTYAVLALKKFDKLSSSDLDELRGVVVCDNGAAKHYAEQILADHPQ